MTYEQEVTILKVQNEELRQEIKELKERLERIGTALFKDTGDKT